MDKEIDSFETWKQDETVWLRIGVPPKENDKQYLLKTSMFEMKFTLYRVAQDLYRSHSYEYFSPHTELPPPSSLFEQSFFAFLVSHPEIMDRKIKIDKRMNETMEKIKSYHVQCEMMIDEIIDIGKYQNDSWSMSDEEAYKTINKATELIYECGKFLGYWTRLKEQSQAAAIGPGASSALVGKWKLDIAIKVLEKSGGYEGYKALPRGEKKAVREEIEKAIKAKDPRNVHNIINKIGLLSKNRKKEN